MPFNFNNNTNQLDNNNNRQDSNELEYTNKENENKILKDQQCRLIERIKCLNYKLNVSKVLMNTNTNTNNTKELNNKIQENAQEISFKMQSLRKYNVEYEEMIGQIGKLEIALLKYMDSSGVLGNNSWNVGNTGNTGNTGNISVIGNSNNSSELTNFFKNKVMNSIQSRYIEINKNKVLLEKVIVLAKRIKKQME